MSSPAPRWFRLASSLFRLCVRLTPRSFRDRFGPESTEAFRDYVDQTFQSRGSAAALNAAAAACGDIARVGVVERAPGWRAAVASGLTTDLRQALRIYRREPILAAAVAVTLALVAGPAVATYGVLYNVALAPLPYPDADRFVAISHVTARGVTAFLPAASISDYRGVSAFSMVGGASRMGGTIVLRGQPELLERYRITSGFLSGLGVPFSAGRDLQRGEPEAVVTRGFALARFGSESAALGEPIVVDNKTMTIVGVIAFAPVFPGRPGGVDLYVPHDFAEGVNPSRQGGNTIVVAKLAPGRSRDEAAAESAVVAASVRAHFGGEAVTPDLIPLRTAISGSLRTPLLILFGAVGAVFLLAATSLGSLVLARATSRAGDTAVRRSLGASRWRLIRAWMFDGAVLAWPGVTLGVLVGAMLVRYLQTSAPARFVMPPDLAVAWPMIGAAIGLATATSVLFAIAPIVAGLLRSSAVSLVRTGRGVAGTRRRWSQSGLIVGEVALSLVLVTSAVWLSTSLSRMLSRPIGFDAAHLVTIRTQSIQRPFAAQLDIAQRMLSRLKNLDSSDDGQVAASSGLPGINAGLYSPLRVRPGQPAFGNDDRPDLSRFAVSTDYFHVLNIPLLVGRTFTAADEFVPERVIIVSRSFASKWFPDGAMGQTVTFAKDDRRDIVGIVEDVHAGRLSQDNVPQFYVPLAESSLDRPTSYIMRTSRSVEAIRSAANAILHDLDPVASIIVMSAVDAMALPLALERLARTLTMGLAIIALLLAVVNVYALSACAVDERTREIGIRLALGARSADAVRLVMRRGLRWVACGLALGAIGTVAVAEPVLRRQLFETQTRDPLLLAMALALVAGAAVSASWWPARRAARIDPAITLRAE